IREFGKAGRTMSGKLLNFGDLHGLVDDEIGVADGRARGRWSVARDDAEIGAGGTFDFVGIAVARGFFDGERAGRIQIGQRDAVSVEGDVAAFGLRDLEQVVANASEGDGLRGGGSRIRDGHFLKIEFIYAEKNGRIDKNERESFHGSSLACEEERRKTVCGRKQ